MKDRRMQARGSSGAWSRAGPSMKAKQFYAKTKIRTAR